MAQKIMYERFGEDFVVNFVAKSLPEAHCPPDLAEQYYQKLQVCSLFMSINIWWIQGTPSALDWKFSH
jgi:hypothetical protein